MFEIKGDLKKARKYYQSAYQKEEIGNLTKNGMLDKMDELKNVKETIEPSKTESTPIPEKKP